MANLVANALRQYGFDVTTPDDAELLSAEDADRLAFDQAAGRVMATHDDDYLRLHEQGLEHAGIAYCHAKKYTPSQPHFALRLLGTCFSAEEMRGRVEYL